MIDQVSFSEIELWLRCPKLWEYRYVHNVHLKPSINTLFGSCYHKALQTNYQQKIRSSKDLPFDGVYGVFKAELGKQLKADMKASASLEPHSILPKGYALLAHYMDTIAPSIQPSEVERPIYSEIEGVKLEIIPDLITNDGVVIDHKTTKSRADYSMIRYNLLPSAIAFCLKRPIIFHYHVAVKGTHEYIIDRKYAETYVFIARTFRTWKDIAHWYDVAEKAIEGIKSGIAPPKSPGCEGCMKERYCKKLNTQLRKKKLRMQ